MIDINLLAPRSGRLAGPSGGTRFAIAAMTVLVALLTVEAVRLENRAKFLRRQVTEVARETDALRPIARQVDELEQTRTRLQQRRAFLQQLPAAQLRLSEGLERIRTFIPGDVWLVALTASGPRLVVDGFTFSYGSVARFMDDLVGSTRFRNVDLISTQKDRIGEREVVKFQIAGDLVTGPISTGPTGDGR